MRIHSLSDAAQSEQDRLNLQHQIWLLCLEQKLYLAPLENVKGGVQNALDFATGTGICEFNESILLLASQTDVDLVAIEFGTHEVNLKDAIN